MIKEERTSERSIIQLNQRKHNPSPIIKFSFDFCLQPNASFNVIFYRAVPERRCLVDGTKKKKKTRCSATGRHGYKYRVQYSTYVVVLYYSRLSGGLPHIKAAREGLGVTPSGQRRRSPSLVARTEFRSLSVKRHNIR